jgi:hypothetical protein
MGAQLGEVCVRHSLRIGIQIVDIDLGEGVRCGLILHLRLLAVAALNAVLVFD